MIYGVAAVLLPFVAVCARRLFTGSWDGCKWDRKEWPEWAPTTTASLYGLIIREEDECEILKRKS